MKLGFNIAIILVSATLCVVGVSWFAGRQVQRTAEGAVDLVKSVMNVTPEVTVTSFVGRQKTAEALELASVTKQFPIEHTYTNKQLASEKRLQLQGNYTVKAGFNLKDRFSVLIDKDTGEVHADFPPPTILSIQLDDYKVSRDENGWWNRLGSEDHATAVNAMNEQARKQAIDLEVLQNARDLLRKQLLELAQKANQHWTITFRDELPQVISSHKILP